MVMKWFVAEEGQDAAEALIGESLLAPDLLIAEVANAAWKKWRRNEIDADQASLAPELAGSFVRLMPSPPLAGPALEIALELGHPVYDCFFLALGETLQMTVITADRRFIRRCQESRFADRVAAL